MSRTSEIIEHTAAVVHHLGRLEDLLAADRDEVERLARAWAARVIDASAGRLQAAVAKPVAGMLIAAALEELDKT